MQCFVVGRILLKIRLEQLHPALDEAQCQCFVLVLNSKVLLVVDVSAG